MNLYLALLCLPLLVNALDSAEAAFVTKLVEDVKDNEDDYINYVLTAGVEIPAAITSLAEQVETYTDDSYTTLFESGSLLGELESFATQLPWYSSRLDDVPVASGSSSASASVASASTSAEDAGVSLYAPASAGVFALLAVLL